MADSDVDAELLALADESGSEQEETKPSSRASTSPPAQKTLARSKVTTATKGVAQKKRSGTTRRRRDVDEEQNGEVSGADSLGSGAMEESDEDEDTKTPPDDGPLFPIEGKFRSEAERARIMALPEVEREQFLAERLEEAQQAAQSAQLKQLMANRAKQDSHQKKRKADGIEIQDTPRKRSTAKVKASENLAAYKRGRQQRHEQRRRDGDQRSRSDRSPSQEERYSDAEGESEVEWDEVAPQSLPARDEAPAYQRDFERVRVGRTNFAKVCYYPGFEDAIRGCFCRVAIGLNRQTGENQYRMTQIKGFTTGRDYQMEFNGRPFKCNFYATLAHGKAEKAWPFTACSDGRFSTEEYERYMDTLSSEGLRAPALSSLRDKCDDISRLLDHRWTEDEITDKLRRQGWLTNTNAGADKERLYTERQRAIADGNEAAIARLDQELAVLEGPKPATASPSNGTPKTAKAPTQQERLAAINRANRKANAEEIRRAQIAEKKRMQQLQSAIERGEAVANPFARVKTKAKIHYDANGETEKPQPPTNKNIDDLFGDPSDMSRTGTPVPGAMKTGNGVKPQKKKKAMDDDILAAMDLGIDIDI